MKKRRAIYFVIASFVLTGTYADGFELRGIEKNNRGVKEYRGGQMAQAYDKFAQGLGDLPFQAEVHYNLGRTYFENKEYEKSLKESLVAEKLAVGRPDLRFHAFFQAGSAAAGLKQIDQAIAFYQKALDVNPQSIEAKTNIELLLSGQGGGGKDGEGGEGGNEGKDDKDSEGKDQNKNDQDRVQQNPNRQPKPFKSDQLSKKDVENILDELQQQEEQIRAKFQREGAKDAPKEKDW